MQGLAPSWLTVVQCVVAGAVIGLCALHWVWWRSELRRSGAAWTLTLSLALAVVLLTNGLLDGAQQTGQASALTFARFCALAAAITLSLPATQAYTRGPSVRALTAAVGGWYLVGAVLWVATDLVGVRGFEDGLPVYGPLSTAVALLPLLAVGQYLVRAVRGRPINPVGAVVTVTACVSALLLVASHAEPASAAGELLRGVWVVPMVIGLHVMAAVRISTVQRAAVRRARMRDALSAVANAALFVKCPEQILDRAIAESRDLLADESIEGSLRPLARHRFVTELYSRGGHVFDTDEQVFLRDIARVVSGAAERQELTNRLGRAASTDSLTQLHNRHSLDRYLTEALEKANVERTRVGLLFCDLDGFKQVNDRHGHEWGDTLLVLTAEHLREVVGPKPFIARHGGDEFVVVIERAGSLDELADLATRLRTDFRPPDDESATTSLTIGVAAWEPGEQVDTSALVRDADVAMLEAKRHRSGVALYDDVLRSRVTAQNALRRDLQNGVANGEIIAHFQPLTNTSTLEVVGLEVLARWRHGRRLRHPAEWLPFAEESGLIVEIGRQMFVAAREGMERFDLPVAVNVAARQLDEPGFLHLVEQAWGDTAWDRLTIEVTESALLHDAEHVCAALAALAEKGVKIALDDFGTGYNSLSRLGELPVHVLKIDRTFVRDIRTPEGAAVLRAILALAEAHHLEVIAEGVERVDELTALIAMNVPTVQGHMLGRPAAGLPVRGPRPSGPGRLTGPRPLISPAASA
ncbi:EAL domain-containing protein [Actinotalea sp. K2]|uniref:putative bifunctional diguanylate cyclase/phosphodiesterase n=1 Tax=Actinotalea sp. K2 TaxID=2939438 RepID=UPI002017373A|nr:EAL domain-containing protein [Actinotalea sp. K2]MCL3862833.1 EAL domain-containing protein [Actinotalea sp. K2]